MIPRPATQKSHGTPLAQGEGYDRQRDLPRLLRLWPQQVSNLTEVDQRWLVEQLGQMLRAERQMGIGRHWSYDLTRHACLLRAWRAEKSVLDTIACRAKARRQQAQSRRVASLSLPDGASLCATPSGDPDGPLRPARAESGERGKSPIA